MAGERLKTANFQCSISPLHWDGPPIDAMRIFAEAGIPVGTCSKILAEHEPMPPEPDVSAELDRILAAYEKDAPPQD